MDKLLSGRRVLVVEDEMLILMMIEDMLTDLGCETVTVAATIDQALALIEDEPFDAALLDMNLSGASSEGVADALAGRGVRFAYSTGNSFHDTKGGFCGRPVLRKPFGYEALTDILTELLAE